jgi:5-methyltetrahydrofolate corrinoid/iron sulfur protein methyltransferase
MFVIGELINGMYVSVAHALKTHDKTVIQKLARDQINAGADALDLNCGPGSKKPIEDMPWLVETVQEVTDKIVVLDSSKPQVIEAGLTRAKNKCIINSTTADQEKLDILIPMAKKYSAGLIGLVMDSRGIPHDKDQRMERAATIVSSCVDAGFSIDDLYLDPIVLPVNVGQQQLGQILGAIREFKIIAEPQPKTVIGLSNVSQGTHVRSLVNRTFLAMAAAYGLDAAILDPLDTELMDTMITAELIMNKQIYCDSYREAYRKK